VQWLRLYVRQPGKHPPCSGGISLRCLPAGASVLPLPNPGVKRL